MYLDIIKLLQHVYLTCSAEVNTAPIFFIAESASQIQVISGVRLQVT